MNKPARFGEGTVMLSRVFEAPGALVWKARTDPNLMAQGIFREAVVPERLVFSSIAIDNESNHLLEGEAAITLTENGGKTTLTLQSDAVGRVPIATQMLVGMEAGWTQSTEKVEDHLDAA